MDLSYFPGCTLKTRARNFEESALAAMTLLGVSLVELPRWNCCGTVYSLADDDLVHHVAPVRNLIRVREQGNNRLVTLCSFCYNTLKRADLLLQHHPENRDTLNSFMDEEIDYDGQVEVVHLLQVLRDDVGWEAINSKVTRPLEGLKVAAYYGCTLTRPAEAAIDSVERPVVLQELLRALGATVIDFPLATDCCGAYEIVNNADSITERAHTILGMAARLGAEAVVVSCPLCSHNLGQGQASFMTRYNDSISIPIVYFTQLLALALGVPTGLCGFKESPGNAEGLLREKGLIVGEA